MNALQQRGIVEFVDNPEHERSPRISLTDKGVIVYKQIRIRDEEAFARLFSVISESDNRTTCRTLKKLVQIFLMEMTTINHERITINK